MPATSKLVTAFRIRHQDFTYDFLYVQGGDEFEMISQNGFETILLTHVNPVAALFSSVVVFLVVAYAESSKLELPLTHGRLEVIVVNINSFGLRITFGHFDGSASC